ncbi:hypothetical protein SAMN02787142_5650 [Burkholderia sp. WP9]|jgi:hypothetical protein|nr:hypothetical protein SAMN02787142_5650 [Burkholderia sp. WP9]
MTFSEESKSENGSTRTPLRLFILPILVWFTGVVLSVNCHVGVWVIRDVYLGDFSVVLGLLWAYTFKRLREPLRNIAAHITVTSVAMGLLVCAAVWQCILALPRFTAQSSRTFDVTYERIGGRKGCRFGVEFRDDFIRDTIRVCGPASNIPGNRAYGRLRVHEATGPWGVYILKLVAIKENRT